MQERIIHCSNKTNLTIGPMAEAYVSYTNDIYRGVWKIGRHIPPEMTTLFVTFRKTGIQQNPQSYMREFAKFSSQFHQRISRGLCTRSTRSSRYHVGIYAMDYDGSRHGAFVPEQGHHIHAVWTIHPNLYRNAIRYANEISGNQQKCGTMISEIHPTSIDLRRVIRYSLKGIISSNGFYPGRDNQYMYTGPL